jgi:dihydroorotate dehydrogenase
LPPLGINIGKSKITEIDQAIEDYRYSFSKLAALVDYVTVNVSSPNTPGLRQLQERDRLLALLLELQKSNTDRKPIFVKVSPDLTLEALEEVISCCIECDVAGIIATNTTLARNGLRTVIDEAGGLSGAPLTKRSLEVVSFIGQRLRNANQRSLALIAVGGISNYRDVLSMLAAGAHLVQIYTGMIYKGPGLVNSLNSGLVAFMNQYKCQSLQEAADIWAQSALES